MKPSSLILLPQITITGLWDAVEGLDTDHFISRTQRILDYVPDLPQGREMDLIRGLHDVPLGEEPNVSGWFAPYADAGVSREWRKIVVRLRVQGHPAATVLAHPEVEDRIPPTSKEVNGDLVLEEQRLARGSVMLRPAARTLGLSMQRRPGSWEEARVPPVTPAGAGDVEALADAVAAKIRPTLGGEKYLEPDPRARALAVLAATVAAVLSHESSLRWYGRKVLVRGDVYRRVFEALDLADHFDAGRRVLEEAHPLHVAVQAPWPPGEGRCPENISVLGHEDGFLTLHPRASLRLDR